MSSKKPSVLAFRVWIPFFLMLCAMTFGSYLFPPLWEMLMERRWQNPPPFDIFTSYRYWSLINWTLWIMVATTFTRNKLGKVKDLLSALLLFLFLFGMSDVIWTFNHRLKWMYLTPDPSWIALQPGNEFHILMFFAITLLTAPFVYFFLHRRKIYDIKIFFLGIGVFWIFNLARVLLSPNPGWTDWGYVVQFYPSSAPKLLNFIGGDLLDRNIILYFIIYAAAKVNNIFPQKKETT